MASLTIVAMDVLDVRFPTSRNLDGSDAMNLDPDYSAAYVVVRTDDPSAPEGHGLTFTIGRGTEIVVAAVVARQAKLRVGARQHDRLVLRGAAAVRRVAPGVGRGVGLVRRVARDADTVRAPSQAPEVVRRIGDRRAGSRLSREHHRRGRK